MNSNGLMTFCSIILGGLITIFTALFVEWMRKPKLKIIDPDGNFIVDKADPTRGKPGRKFRRLAVQNISMNRPFNLVLSRNPALSCAGHIRFVSFEITPRSIERMPIRWSGSAQPYVPIPTLLHKYGWLYNPFALIENRTIHCGSPEFFDLAACEDKQDLWYGWCNETYQGSHNREKWKLGQGKHFMHIEIRSGDARVEDYFMFSTYTGAIERVRKCCIKNVKKMFS